ncbi:MAG TPA: thiamine phosphate synthase [Rhodocyclaceae bacterium]|nr:MAG: thiamine-phosphate diphosphorylase [Betaproteobacteria bacterium CG2_30_68_42]PIY42436.1 MAG: thiamine phosphate synthase [Armatimonadetes bacterium CG_4_10_14_3_um_filter_59_10]PJA56340.1 MAG: thiamine phosphate synthase [Rhodocyclales bacterium CG_4_9_14_3_um_filter_68_10]HCX34608.1 thiamine phosphate synthase [Rhodocyclaceae bacterium]
MLPDLPQPLRGLYALTPDVAREGAFHTLIGRVEEAIRGGACLVQYRNKSAAAGAREAQARALLEACRHHRCPLVINDDPELALRIGADGVHLGREDGDIARARRALGPRAIVGASCYDDLGRAAAAERDGASYVAFGAFFPSPTKPAAVRAGLALLREARARLHLPIAAIGGITADTGAGLIRAGADLLAVVSDLFDAPDVGARARAYSTLFVAALAPAEVHHESQ